MTTETAATADTPAAADIREHGSSPMDDMQVISARQIDDWLDYPSLIDALRAAFIAGCDAPRRHRHQIPAVMGADGSPGKGGIMLLKPAWRASGPIAVKIVNVFPDNASRGLPSVLGTLLLFDGETGAPIAMMDGSAITVRRTAAASALAADFLARRDAVRLLVVGTGQLAPALAEAHATIRPLRDIRVWGRSPDKAAALARSLNEAGLPAHPVNDLEAGAREADIITCATLATSPLIRGAWLKPGAHLDLVGGFTPDMREADDAAMRRGRLFVDTRDGALAEAGDLIQPIAAGAITEADVVGELSELCRGSVAGRGGNDEITVFKSVGAAIEDLAAAELALARAGD
jgi:ornithine cyclodeaminase/alanine dehydrogenase-like protein (mu-crystallin family)